MTAQNDDPGTETTPSEPQLVRESNAEPDVILRTLVDMVNRVDGMEIGLTLHVSGVIVSGLLISFNSYLHAMGNSLRDNGSQESQPVRESLASFFESFIDPSAQAEAHDDDGQTINFPTCIHMRAATVHEPGADYYLPETLWRGRLSQVSAWSIGNFGLKPPPTQ